MNKHIFFKFDPNCDYKYDSISRIEPFSESELEKHPGVEDSLPCYREWMVFKCFNCEKEIQILNGHMIHVSKKTMDELENSTECPGG